MKIITRNSTHQVARVHLVQAKSRWKRGEQWLGVVRAEAKDRKVGGGVKANLNMNLDEKGPDETEMHIVLDAHILGKIGEFGQPLIRKKTDDLLQNFAAEVSKQLSAE